MIAVERLYKRFGRTQAVRNVSFRAERGEVVGLLGPNGSGKTTILRTLAGFFPPTSGRVCVAGIDVSVDSIGAREMVGYLPENAVLYPEMRVRELLQFCAGVRQLRGDRRSQRVGAVEAACGLTKVRGRLIGQLSKGFRQRVGLAQALLHDPPVLILDEPTVGLDPEQILQIRELIRSLRGRTTVLLSTHILTEAASLCDRVVIINRGEVVAEDRADALTRNLGEAERTLVRVVGRGEEILSAVCGVPGVQGGELEDEGTAASLGPSAGAVGVCRLLIRSEGGDDVRAAIASMIVGRGWPLAEIRPVPPTLEDLFVRLVHEERADEPA